MEAISAASRARPSILAATCWISSSMRMTSSPLVLVSQDRRCNKIMLTSPVTSRPPPSKPGARWPMSLYNVDAYALIIVKIIRFIIPKLDACTCNLYTRVLIMKAGSKQFPPLAAAPAPRFTLTRSCPPSVLSLATDCHGRCAAIPRHNNLQIDSDEHRFQRTCCTCRFVYFAGNERRNDSGHGMDPHPREAQNQRRVQ